MQYVYLIKCQQFHKIGVANDVESRLAQLSTGNPYPLAVIACYGFSNAEVVEKSLHQRFSKERERGEWFLLDENGVMNFKHICAVLGGEIYCADDLPTDAEVGNAEVIQGERFSGEWVELVKVKKWYSMRLMRWDATNKRKVYVKYIGTLEKCKNDPVYSAEAYRLERELEIA